jgi:Protein of unknown function (DUF1524)
MNERSQTRRHGLKAGLCLATAAFMLIGTLALAAPANASRIRVRALLTRLPVRAETNSGYDRSKFTTWTDADHDGCDTRAEVLIVESLVKVTKTSGCLVVSGKWPSIFDGRTWKKASDVDIDHHVPLAEAWGSGAKRWSATQRMLYANDLRYRHSLNAMTDNLNSSKSDGDPAQWLPPRLRCKYVTWWMQVKYRWRLSIDSKEKAAIRKLVSVAACGGIRVKLAPRAPMDNGSGGGGNCDPSYPTVCIPSPPPDLDCGDIPYRNFKVVAPDDHHFDGNADGVGCET